LIREFRKRARIFSSVLIAIGGCAAAAAHGGAAAPPPPNQDTTEFSPFVSQESL